MYPCFYNQIYLFICPIHSHIQVYIFLFCMFCRCYAWLLGTREEAGQNRLHRLKNRQLQTHPHLWHIRNLHSGQMSKNTTGLQLPANPLLITLPSGKRLRAIRSKTSHFLSSTYCRTIKSLNGSSILHQHFTNAKQWLPLNFIVFCIWVYF